MFDDRAQEIFADALEVEPSAREAFLRDACGGDAGLRADVEGMLADAEEAETFFSVLTRGAGDLSKMAFRAQDTPGTRIGPYELVSMLGKGGFGVVWMAEQTAPVRRTVALKVIKAGMGSEEVLVRFDAERQALALMEHPNIARVFDAGTTADGRPFFVMELVRGEPVTQFCDAHKLDMRARIGIFLDVCAAVNHAHQKGVIHRDLKPSNVLVGMADGRPLVKVIDFGIAKAVSGRLTDHALVTSIEQLVGTPAYMSPEQAGLGGLDIDTRCDVYALGVILYELLAGGPPFDPKTLARAGHEEIRRIIREDEPPRPSARITSMPFGEKSSVAGSRQTENQYLDRLIASELDWVVMKAIEKDRARRYETADALAQDLGRFLADEPVSARPPSAAYLFGKFARRHRGVLAAGSGFVVLMVVATAISAWLAFRATQAEQLASRRLGETLAERNAKAAALKDAEAVSSLLIDVFQKPDPDADGRSVTVAAALKSAGEKLDAELADHPARLALLKETLARTYEGLALYPEALELRRQACRIRWQLGDDRATLGSLAVLVGLLSEFGYYAEAYDYGKAEVDLLDRLDGPQAESTKNARSRLEVNAMRSGRTPLPKPVFSVPEVNQVPGTFLDDAAYRAALEKRVQEAEAGEQSVRADPAATFNERLTALGSLASAYSSNYQAQQAAQTGEQMLEMIRAKFGDMHVETLYAERELANLYWRVKLIAKSCQLRVKNLESSKKVFGPDDIGTLYIQGRVAQHLMPMEPQRALVLAKDAADRLMRVAGLGNGATFNAMRELSLAYLREGRVDLALSTIRQIAPEVSDDTFASQAYLCFLLWEGETESYREGRRRRITATQAFYSGERYDAHRLYRTAWQCLLAPLDAPAQGELLANLIARADAIPEPKKSFGKAQENLTKALLAVRMGQDEQALAFLRALEESPPPSEPPALWALQCQTACVRSLALQHLGLDEEALAAFDVARSTLKPQPAQGTPFGSLAGYCGDPLDTWLLFKETEKAAANGGAR